MVYNIKRGRVNREIRHQTQVLFVEDAIGDIYPGMEVFGLTQGQFSIIAIIEHILNQTGPADVNISTWTVANYDMGKAKTFLENKNIKDLKWLVDESFPQRQPEYFNNLVKAFGQDVIRVIKSHCKFVNIRNDKWNIVIRTSMNLNENKRLENYEISDCKGLSDYLYDFMSKYFDKPFAATMPKGKKIESFGMDLDIDLDVNI